MPAESNLLGIGVDLATTEDFAAKEDGGEELASLVLDDREIALARELFPEELPAGYTYAFAAKEAAFKSTAAPLRAWYLTHDEELIFEVREFVQTTSGHMEGIGRKARAEAACEKMGVSDIIVSHRILPGMVFTMACAVTGPKQ